MSKIPPDAFEFYVALGPDRSYQRVADHYDVSKRGVAKHAGRESWPSRLDRIEREVRERSEEKLVESLEKMRTRHLVSDVIGYGEPSTMKARFSIFSCSQGGTQRQR